MPLMFYAAALQILGSSPALNMPQVWKAAHCFWAACLIASLYISLCLSSSCSLSHSRKEGRALGILSLGISPLLSQRKEETLPALSLCTTALLSGRGGKEEEPALLCLQQLCLPYILSGRRSALPARLWNITCLLASIKLYIPPNYRSLYNQQYRLL